MPIITNPQKLNFKRYNSYIKYKMEECAKKFPGKSIKIFTCVYPMDDDNIKPISKDSMRSYSDPHPVRRLKQYVAKGPKTKIKALREGIKDYRLVKENDTELVYETPLVITENDLGSHYSGEVEADVQMLGALPMIRNIEYKRTNYMGCCFFNEDIRLPLDESKDLIEKEIIRRKSLDELMNEVKIEISFQKVEMQKIAAIEESKVFELKEQEDETTRLVRESKMLNTQVREYIAERIKLIDDLNIQINRLSVKIKDNDGYLNIFRENNYWGNNSVTDEDDDGDGIFDD